MNNNCSNCKHKGECPNYNKKEVKMAEIGIPMSEKEGKVYEYLKAENKPIALENLKAKFGENAIGVIGKLKQLNIIDITTNYKATKKYRKQVELKINKGGE